MHRLLCAFLLVCSVALAQQGGSLTLVSGNGQLVSEQFVTTLPMVVVARDAAGRVVPGLPIQWSISTGRGTLNQTVSTTDASGQASTFFLGTSLSPGISYETATVRASSSLGAVEFFVTTSANRTVQGTPAPPPLSELLNPPSENRTISGTAGARLAGAIRVRVVAQSGVFVGQPVPNVGVRILPADDPATQPSASCDAPGGVVLTDQSGTAVCNLILGSVVGTGQIRVSTGEYTISPTIALQVSPGQTCTFNLSSSSVVVGSSGGNSSVQVTTAAGCSWTASSNVPWLSIASGTSGTGNGQVTFSTQANGGSARTGTLTIAGEPSRSPRTAEIRRARSTSVRRALRMRW